MNFNSVMEKDVVVFRLQGDLIGEQYGLSIIAKADDHIADGILKCIVDISEIRYINSSGIGILITLLTKFRNKGGEVCLLKPSENVRKLLIITKLNAIFSVAETMDEAVEKIQNVD